MPPIFGALEAGGTKMVCAAATAQGQILDRLTIPTRTPQETIPELLAFFRDKGLSALGVGSFGPLELDPRSPDYGVIQAAPKASWRGCPILALLRDGLGLPVGLDTDVNAAALGETLWGSARGTACSVYITVGTGVGLGVVIGGRPHHGMLHPEGGHVPVTRQSGDPLDPGGCDFHPSCLEGLASGPAIARRWGRPAQELGDRPEVWALEANYLAQAICGYIMTLSPEKVILGGGVMHQPQLLPLVRRETARLLGGYLPGRGLADLDTYIVAPGLGDDQGILGCVQLAADAYLASGGAL